MDQNQLHIGKENGIHRKEEKEKMKHHVTLHSVTVLRCVTPNVTP